MQNRVIENAEEDTSRKYIAQDKARMEAQDRSRMEAHDGPKMEAHGKLIGQGAFAEVYLGYDAQDKEVAYKVSEQTAMLQKESKVLRRIHHELFPKYYGYREAEGKGYLQMEYVKGENLERQLEAGVRFTEETILEIGLQLTQGLQYLHELPEPILFRDIKPENIILMGNKVKLVDCGCVCGVGKNNSIAGTPEFAAPELLTEGSWLEVTADVYCLGKTLLYLAAKSNLLLQRNLRSVLRKCVEKLPCERIPNMYYLHGMLENCKKNTKFTETEKAILKGKLTFHKNIWKYDIKNS